MSVETMSDLEDRSHTLAFAGDWHGNVRYASKAMYYAKKNGSDIIIHVGDFGFWPDSSGESRFQKVIAEEAERLDLFVLWVDGNHENHDAIDKTNISHDGTRKFYDRVWHLPRGFRWKWNGVEFLSMGGAHSVDKNFREEGFDWFDREHISIAEMYKATQGEGPVDVMVSHDCPSGVDIPLGPSDWITEENLMKADTHRKILGKVVDEVRPRFIFHGHYHVNYSRVRNFNDSRGGSTLVYGLNCDGFNFNENITIFPIEKFL